MSQWKQCDFKCWTLDVERWALGVEKEPRRLLTPEYKFLGRAEEAQLVEVSGQALNRLL